MAVEVTTIWVHRSSGSVRLSDGGRFYTDIDLTTASGYVLAARISGSVFWSSSSGDERDYNSFPWPESDPIYVNESPVTGEVFVANPQDETADAKLTVGNAAPTFTATPVVDYGTGFTAVGPNNSAELTFTAEDVDTEDQGANALSWELRTAASGGGTLVDSGTCTHSSQEIVTINDTKLSNAGIGDGSTTLYLRVTDGTAYSSDESFSIKRDSTDPTASTSVSYSPDPVDPNNDQYTVTFTPNDATSTGVDELSYEITTLQGGGTLLASGSATSGTPETTSTIIDSSLSEGDNTRWIRVTDGAGNTRDDSFTVHLASVFDEESGSQVILAITAADDETVDVDEEDAVASLLDVISSGTDTQDMVDEDSTGVVVLVVSGGTDEVFTGYFDLGPPMVIQAVTTAGDETVVLDEESDTAELVLVVTAGDISGTIYDHTGDIPQLVEVVTASDLEQYDYADLEPLIVEVVSDGFDHQVMVENDSDMPEQIIAAVTEGVDYTGQLLEDFGNGPLLIAVVTEGEDDYFISKFLPVRLVSWMPVRKYQR